MLKYTSTLLVFICAFAVTFFLSSGKEFRYDSDVLLSPVGVSIAKNFNDPAPNMEKGFQGYIQDGEHRSYANWPPLGFVSLSTWLQLPHKNAIAHSRLFSLIIYSVCSLLLFMLLLKNGVSVMTACFSSIIFIVLPFHLRYSDLIYVDIWLPLFWLLMGLAYIGTRLKYYWIILVLGGVGLQFMWFIPFLLPAPILIYLFKKRAFSLRQQLFILLVLALGIILVQYTIIANSESILLDRLRLFSIFGIFQENTEFKMVIMRLLSIVYEASPLLLLAALVKVRMSCFQVFKSEQTKLYALFKFYLIGLFFLFVTFPNWILIHVHSLYLFSIPIGIFAAFMITQTKRKVLYSSLTIAASLTLFFIIPFVTVSANKVKESDEAMVHFINTKTKNRSEKTGLFYDIPMPSALEKKRIRRIAINAQTNTYDFSCKAINADKDLARMYGKGVFELEQIGIKDYSKTSFFLVRDRPISNEYIEDSLVLNQLTIYYFSF